MVRKMTPAQYNAWVRQENARRNKRAVDAHNAEVRRVNAHNQRVVTDHNRKVAAHNQQPALPTTGGRGHTTTV